MSQIPFTPDPIAVDCAKKAGLPDWYVGDPMSAKPSVALDPKKEKDYADCYRNKIQSPQRNKKYLHLFTKFYKILQTFTFFVK